MSGGAFIRYSSTWDPAAVRALLADITGGGLTLGHPTTGLVSFIGADGPDSGTD